MHSRRSFISSLSQASIAVALSRNLETGTMVKQHPIGLLLGTVEKEMTADAERTLQKIAAIGYKELEYPGNYGYAADALKAIIRKNKLVSVGGGNNITELTNHFANYVEEYNNMGKKYVFCYWPWFDDGKNKNISDWKKQADLLNRLGEKYKSAGLRLAYHNHDIEFVETEKQIPYAVLLENTNPELLAFEMDIWWIRKAGHMPLTYIEKYPGRFEVCHIRTAALIEGNEEVNPLNYKEVLSHAAQAGFKHYILENEPGIKDPFVYFEKSYALLSTLI